MHDGIDVGGFPVSWSGWFTSSAPIELAHPTTVAQLIWRREPGGVSPLPLGAASRSSFAAPRARRARRASGRRRGDSERAAGTSRSIAGSSPAAARGRRDGRHSRSCDAPCTRTQRAVLTGERDQVLGTAAPWSPPMRTSGRGRSTATSKQVTAAGTGARTDRNSAGSAGPAPSRTGPATSTSSAATPRGFTASSS